MKIDLSQIAAPAIIQAFTIADIKAQLLAAIGALEPTLVNLSEADPAMKIVELCAYREALLRQKMNDQTWGNTLAKGEGYFLDFCGAVYGLKRLTITPANLTVYPPIAAVLESDADFRARIQLAPESLSVAGPVGAYAFWAKTVADVLDVSVESPEPGAVVVTVLSRTGSGTASQPTLDAVSTALEGVRPLTDQVTVQTAMLVDYAIAATIYTFSGPDPATIIAACQTSVNAYAVAQKRLGLDITLSGLYAALHRPGVQRVNLTSPSANVTVASDECAHCTGIALTNGGIAQ